MTSVKRAAERPTERRRDRPAVQAFLAALADPAVRARIGALGMTPV